MSNPWLHIVGIGEDGLNGLSQAALAELKAAEIILGGERHHALTEGLSGERLLWPKPFDHMIETLEGFKGRSTAVLVTGDPLWFSAGVRIAQRFTAQEMIIHPHVSAFQLACARMGWALSEVETLTVHGRALGDIAPFVVPGAKLILLSHDGETPAKIAAWLTEVGYGHSRLTVLGAMGGLEEMRLDGVADCWRETVPAFNTLCVECVGDADLKPTPRGPGLPDNAFEHDGKMTKRDIRALTLAKLAPRPGHLLWDIGAGCGSVGIEWMRSARGALAIGIEPHAERRAIAGRNAQKLGASRFVLIDGVAPDVLAELERPDAIFLGGGLSAESVEVSLKALKPFGRLVANAVTLESEQLLIDLHNKHGGDLSRVSLAHADAVGRYRGWRPAMPVTQWSLTL